MPPLLPPPPGLNCTQKLDCTPCSLATRVFASPLPQRAARMNMYLPEEVGKAIHTIPLLQPQATDIHCPGKHAPQPVSAPLGLRVCQPHIQPFQQPTQLVLVFLRGFEHPARGDRQSCSSCCFPSSSIAVTANSEIPRSRVSQSNDQALWAMCLTNPRSSGKVCCLANQKVALTFRIAIYTLLGKIAGFR